ncbi:hypothetical protein [Kitasatospora sp. NPDC007106]|uniref:hypothetical protein n=1 Tax=Kitasatospora sp. NPDC007106 TaxID=3156914 RepID=UPI0033D18425
MVVQWWGGPVLPERQEEPAPAAENPMVSALLRERAGYEARGLADRVRQVDDALRMYGYEPADTAGKGDRDGGQL